MSRLSRLATPISGQRRRRASLRIELLPVNRTSRCPAHFTRSSPSVDASGFSHPKRVEEPPSRVSARAQRRRAFRRVTEQTVDSRRASISTTERDCPPTAIERNTAGTWSLEVDLVQVGRARQQRAGERQSPPALYSSHLALGISRPAVHRTAERPSSESANRDVERVLAACTLAPPQQKSSVYSDRHQSLQHFEGPLR
jgi:hypothetical protein